MVTAHLQAGSKRNSRTPSGLGAFVPIRLLHLTLAVATLSCALAIHGTAAFAGPLIGVADDDVLAAGDKIGNETVAEWQDTGVDVVRLTAVWNHIAPTPNAKKAPTGFRAADPNTPGYYWYELDTAVRRVRDAGLPVILTITGPGPVWASSQPGKRSGALNPRISEVTKFVQAVATRYRNDVNQYILWNEPNLSLFLEPQQTCSRRSCTMVAAHLYRRIVRAAYPAIKRADPGSQVLIGALAPRGAVRANTAVSPLGFLRAFACVDARFRKLRTGYCSGFQPAKGDGFAIHPYSGRRAPGLATRVADDIDLASLPKLERVLDRLQRMGRIRATTGRFGLYIDEYGFQTNPPDRVSGVSPKTQDAWLQQAAYMAWRDNRVKLFVQYLWRDSPKRNGSWATWQSGVRYQNGGAKPSLAHFSMPFFLDVPRGRLWGQVRPGGRQRVFVQERGPGSTQWRTVKQVMTDSLGYWVLKRRLLPRTSYRFATLDATSGSRQR